MYYIVRVRHNETAENMLLEVDDRNKAREFAKEQFRKERNLKVGEHVISTILGSSRDPKYASDLLVAYNEEFDANQTDSQVRSLNGKQ